MPKFISGLSTLRRSLLVSAAAFLVVATGAYAATSIGTNISTGTLTLSGGLTLQNAETISNATDGLVTVGGAFKVGGLTTVSAGLATIGAAVSDTAADVSANVGRVNGLQMSLSNTGATVTGLRGVNAYVTDNGGTGDNVVALQGAAFKTAGTSTGELWGTNSVVQLTGGSVVNTYGVVGDLTIDGGTVSGTDLNNIAAAGFFTSYISSTATVAKAIDSAVVANISGNDGRVRSTKGTFGVVSMLNGSATTESTVGADAAFKVMDFNTSGGNFDYGLDLYYHQTTPHAFDNVFNTADIRLQNGETISNSTDGTIAFGAAKLTASDSLTLSGTGANELAVTGAPAASATSSLAQLGAALVGGSASGTFVGVNAASGYTGDLVNAQVNGTTAFRVAYDGNTCLGNCSSGGGGTPAFFSLNSGSGVTFARGGPNAVRIGQLNVSATDSTALGIDVETKATNTSTSNGLLEAGYFRNTYAGTAAHTGYMIGMTIQQVNSAAFASTTTMKALSIDNQITNASGAAASAYGMEVTAVSTNSGTVTNALGIDIHANVGTITNQWGLIQEGASDNNFFRGKTRIASAAFSTTVKPNGYLDVLAAPTATANYGLVSIGSAAADFDGATAGFFAGSSSGTQLAINAASGYAGNLVDYQVAGVSKYSIAANGQITSTLATGTAPLVVASTTPVANLTTVPATYNAAGTQQTATHLVFGSCAIGSTCAITLAGSAVFSSSSSYTCTGTDLTAAAAVQVAQASGTSVTFTGTGTDTVHYICVGN